MMAILKAIGIALLVVIVACLVVATLYASLFIVVASAVIMIGYLAYKFISATEPTQG